MELWDYAELSPEELLARIKEAKERKGAVILSLNYQRPEIQQVADFLGDSLQLARKATEIDADIIVFCGVLF
ncbi:MAG TPA: quinolinate synthase NadA, partial [candidate division Zixibacteria bacterium]|nr:quinolinate synthase NadA [candidate division Zixibacteria bacterium]